MNDVPEVRSAEVQDRRVRIAFVIDRLFLPAGGTETQLVYLLENLDRSRFAPKLFCLQPSQWLESGFHAAEAEVVDIHLGFNLSVLGHIRRFAHLLRDQSFDIVQTQFRDSNIVGVLAAHLAGIQVVVSTRRGVPYWSTGAGLLFLRALNRRVTRFLANSEATAERLILTERVRADRVDVIHSGLDVERFAGIPRADREELRDRLGIPASAPVVGIVANQRAVKGNDVFLQAASRVLERAPECYFVLVGEGPERARLRELADELGLGPRALFLGARQDVPDLLQIFDVGVLASRFESFSTSILEYLASDLPVVVTDVGGARESVREGADGFLVPPDRPDAMAEKVLVLLEHPQGARAWRSESGLPPKFHLQNAVGAHERYYESLVSRFSI